MDLPDIVAKVVLNAATNENPNLRYLAGNDVEQWLRSKRNVSDEDIPLTDMLDSILFNNIVGKGFNYICARLELGLHAISINFSSSHSHSSVIMILTL